MLNLDIITENKETIQQSFDRIAVDIIHNWSLKVDQDIYSFTEIEFYFFFADIHEDNSTHEHKYDKCKWRFHLQGLDITFQTTEKSDGGILIRGLKTVKGNVNGPKRVLESIFKSLGDVVSIQKEFGLILKTEASSEQIRKTIRHGLSKTQDNPFKDSFYRYFVDIDNWTKEHVSQTEKERIINNSIIV
ncbi:MAG: hypothetical protein WDO71_23560 [Bacteroidota bacterium]